MNQKDVAAALRAQVELLSAQIGMPMTIAAQEEFLRMLDARLHDLADRVETGKDDRLPRRRA